MCLSCFPRQRARHTELLTLIEGKTRVDEGVASRPAKLEKTEKEKSRAERMITPNPSLVNFTYSAAQLHLITASTPLAVPLPVVLLYQPSIKQKNHSLGVIQKASDISKASGL